MFFYLRDRLHFNYIRKYYITTIYFLILSLGTILFFRSEYSSLIIKANQIIPILVLLLTIVINCLIYYFGKKIPYASEFLQQYGHAHNQFITLDYRYLIAKSAEILFQEVFIVLGIILLYEKGLTLFHIILVFGSFFILVHILHFIFWHKRKKVPTLIAWIFTITPIGNAILAPIFVLSLPYGFIYSFCMHFLFYGVLGIILRKYFVQQRKINFIS